MKNLLNVLILLGACSAQQSAQAGIWDYLNPLNLLPLARNHHDDDVSDGASVVSDESDASFHSAETEQSASSDDEAVFQDAVEERPQPIDNIEDLFVCGEEQPAGMLSIFAEARDRAVDGVRQLSDATVNVVPNAINRVQQSVEQKVNTVVDSVQAQALASVNELKNDARVSLRKIDRRVNKTIARAEKGLHTAGVALTRQAQKSLATVTAATNRTIRKTNKKVNRMLGSTQERIDNALARIEGAAENVEAITARTRYAADELMSQQNIDAINQSINAVPAAIDRVNHIADQVETITSPVATGVNAVRNGITAAQVRAQQALDAVRNNGVTVAGTALAVGGGLWAVNRAYQWLTGSDDLLVDEETEQALQDDVADVAQPQHAVNPHLEGASAVPARPRGGAWSDTLIVKNVAQHKATLKKLYEDVCTSRPADQAAVDAVGDAYLSEMVARYNNDDNVAGENIRLMLTMNKAGADLFNRERERLARNEDASISEAPFAQLSCDNEIKQGLVQLARLVAVARNLEEKRKARSALFDVLRLQ